MTRHLVSILFLFFLLAQGSYSQISSNDQLLRQIIAEKKQAVVKIPSPGISAINQLSGKVSIASVKDQSVEIFLSPLTVEWFISQNFNYEIVPDTESKDILTSVTMEDAMQWNCYPSFSQYVSIMQYFASTYPSLCRLDTIGTSIYGKLLLALKISDNPGINQDKPETFYTSTMHGNEPSGFILMLHLCDYLLTNYNTDSLVKNLVDNLQIWINPLSNPDGLYGTGDTISYPTRFNAAGVDLNRNFPDPIDPTIKQTKENVEMISFMKSHHFVVSANFHSGDEVVNYPWDRWERLHADNDWFIDISRKFVDTVHFYSSIIDPAEHYMSEFDNGITDGYAWYQVIGGRQDYMTYSLHGREVTVELDFSYVTAASRLTTLWQYDWKSFLGYIENALYGIHGHVTDKSTGKPVAAMIFINGHDMDSSMVFSDSISGSFVRLIAPGTWTLEISAKGYYSTSVEVEVIDGKPTDLDVELVPVANAVDTIATPVIIIYPDPANEFVKMVLPQSQIGQIRVQILSSSGKIVSDYNDVGYEKTPLVLNTSEMASGVYIVKITNISSGAVDIGRFVIVRSR